MSVIPNLEGVIFNDNGRIKFTIDDDVDREFACLVDPDTLFIYCDKNGDYKTFDYNYYEYLKTTNKEVPCIIIKANHNPEEKIFNAIIEIEEH